jgi:metal-sulfur cluster biosynthetic enzyme
MSTDTAASIAAESAVLERLATVTDPDLRREIFASLALILDLALGRDAAPRA